MKHSTRSLLLFATACVVGVATFLSMSRENRSVKSSVEEVESMGEREQWEWERLHDPATGIVPFNMRSRELAFARTLPRKEGQSFFKQSVWDFQWRSRGPYNLGGRTRALAVDVTNKDVFIAGGAVGGVWRSENRGATWTRVTSRTGVPGASCIVQDPRPGKENVWYYGTGDVASYIIIATDNSAKRAYPSEGMFKSQDGGRTWSPLPATLTGTSQIFDQAFDFVANMVVDPSNTAQDVVYAATFGAIARSTDGGTTWNFVLGTPLKNPYTDVAVTNSGVVYAYLGGKDTMRGVWRSVDGVHWQHINPSGLQDSCRRGVLAIAPSNQKVVYLLNEGFKSSSYSYGFQRYTDSAGGIWEDRSGNIPAGGSIVAYSAQGGYDMLLKVKPDNENIVFFGGTNLYRTNDGLRTQSTVSIGGYELNGKYSLSGPDTLHPDQHTLVFVPGEPESALSGSDGGVRLSTNIMATRPVWQSLSNGYTTTQFYSTSLDHATPGSQMVIGGLQDNGSWAVLTGGTQDPWKVQYVGDGMISAVADNAAFCVVSTQGANLRRTFGPDSTIRVLPSTVTGTKLFVHPYALDPSNTNTLYLPCGTSIYRNPDLTIVPISTASNWTTIPNTQISSTSYYTAIGVSRDNPSHRLYVGTRDGKVFRFDSAHTGTPLPVNVTGATFPSGAYVSCIGIDPKNANHAIVVFSNYQVRSLFATTDAGTTWTEISGNLEQNPDGSGDGPSCRWATILHRDSQLIYFIGTSAGLYSCTALKGATTTWSLEGASVMGTAVVEMMDVRLSDGYITVATHGDGMFSGMIPTSGVRDGAAVQASAIGLQHSPDPVTNRLTVAFNLPSRSDIHLDIYDMLGREAGTIAEGTVESGEQRYVWDASAIPAGAYIIRLRTPLGTFTQSFRKQ